MGGAATQPGNYRARGNARGMAQGEIALKAEAEYVGRIVVWGDSGVKLKVKLSWGSAEGKVSSKK